ncbi:MAG: redoxin domain-containing protein [Deltaproteobacteria bacterium]|nr:MAG: redoxin domain-containing protein [Deltaproteobacteria bacterium]
MYSSTRYQKGLLFLGLLLASGVYFAGGASAIEVGDKAPEFKLPATTGVDISLSEFRGKKWILIEFYGADFAPT